MALVDVEPPVLEVDDYSDLTDRVPAVDSDREIIAEGFHIYASPSSLAGAEKRAEGQALGRESVTGKPVTKKMFRQASQRQAGQ